MIYCRLYEGGGGSVLKAVSEEADDCCFVPSSALSKWVKESFPFRYSRGQQRSG